MSFMPNPGSFVKLKDGRYAVISSVKTKGPNLATVLLESGEEEIGAWDIAEIIREPDLPKACPES